MDLPVDQGGVLVEQSEQSGPAEEAGLHDFFPGSTRLYCQAA